MKKLFLTLGICTAIFAGNAQTIPDLSADYYIIRPEGTQAKKAFKDGKKVTFSDKGIIEGKFQLSGMEGGGWETFSWGTEAASKKQQGYTSVRFCTGGSQTSTTGAGQELIEIEQGILVSGDFEWDLGSSGECTSSKVLSISLIFVRDLKKKESLTLSKVKAKVNELLVAICEVTKNKTPQVKDLRGLSNMSGGAAADFSASKKISGTYYTYRNPDVTAHQIYGDCKTAEITDNGEQIKINSKFMGVKKIEVTFSMDNQLLEIEKKGGHKIMRSDANTAQYNFGDAYLVEIEEGVIVIATYIDMDFSFESSCEAKADNICYVFFKDKDKCSSIGLGDIKTKFKEVMKQLCQAYQKGLSAPKSSVAVVLPEAKNTDKSLEPMAWSAIQNYAKNMGWKETLIGCYIVSADWSPVTKKEYINNSYIDVVKARQKNCIVFFKTDRGIYKSQGFSIAQNAVAGDYTGKNFNTGSVYVAGILDGLPGSGWNIQVVTEADAMRYKK